MIACLTQCASHPATGVNYIADLCAPASIHFAGSGVPVVLAGLALAVGTIAILVLLRRQLLRALLLLALFAMVLAPAVLLFRHASGRQIVRFEQLHLEAARVGGDALEAMAEVRHEVAGVAEAVVVKVQSLGKIELPSPIGPLSAYTSRIYGPPDYVRGVWLKRILSFGAVGLFLFLTYLFFDSGTRGQFTWPLRFLTVLAFIGICVTIASIGGLR